MYEGGHSDSLSTDKEFGERLRVGELDIVWEGKVNQHIYRVLADKFGTKYVQQGIVKKGRADKRVHILGWMLVDKKLTKEVVCAAIAARF